MEQNLTKNCMLNSAFCCCCSNYLNHSKKTMQHFWSISSNSTCINGLFLPLTTSIRKNSKINIVWKALKSIQNIDQAKHPEQPSDLRKYTVPGKNRERCPHSDKKHFIFFPQSSSRCFVNQKSDFGLAFSLQIGMCHTHKKAALLHVLRNITLYFYLSIMLSVYLNEEILSLSAVIGCFYRLFATTYQERTLLSPLSFQVIFHFKFDKISCLQCHWFKCLIVYFYVHVRRKNSDESE